jgi:phage shock protein PspC (stress-responsive transcriptional regulator)
MLAGICAGVAKHFGVSVILVRVICVLLGLFLAVIPGALLYFILTIFIPEEPNKFKR